MKYWLFKSEPDAFSIDDLARAPDSTAAWDGVRNYQARNFLRDGCRPGDGVLFYHSSTDEPGVAGTAEVVRTLPDPSQFDPHSKYHDPDSPPDDPRWITVEVRFAAKFPRVVTLAELRAARGLEEMVVLRRGNRLSVTPVTAREWNVVNRLAARGPAGP